MTFLQSLRPFTHPTKAKYVGLLIAFIIIVVTVLQLYRFERFDEVLTGAGVPFAGGIAVLFVASQVMSLPFLLGMQASRWVMHASQYAGYTVAVLWVFLSSLTSVLPEVNSGFGGATLFVPGGWPVVLFALSFAIALTYSGLAKTAKKHH